MLPIGPLMVEHRLIEKVIRNMAARLEVMETARQADPVAVERIVYFFRAYADRCHHGKEEDILFRELARKEMSPEHRRIMAELIEEHRIARGLAESVSEANARYRRGEEMALSGIADGFRGIIELYPKHILKEDHAFFIPVMDYFSREEKDAILRLGYEADSRLLHQESEALVAGLDIGLPSRR